MRRVPLLFRLATPSSHWSRSGLFWCCF